MDAQTRLDPKVREFTQTIQSLLDEVASMEGGSRPGFRELEERVRQAVQALGHAATECVLSAYGSGRGSNQRACSCGGFGRFKKMCAKELVDLHGGTLRLERAYYYCDACKQGCLPLDEELGIGRNEMTPALADVVELMGVVAPFECGSRLLQRMLGIELSGERIRRATEATGQRCLKADQGEAERAVAPSSREGPPAPNPESPSGERRYVMPDGGMVPTVDGYREAKLGVCFAAADHVQVSETKAVLLRKRFFGDITTAEDFGKHLYAAARRSGVATDGAGCDVLGDGAPWIWNLRAEHLPAAGENVDWYHAKEKIFTTAHALYGEGTAKATSWANARADELWDEKHATLLAVVNRLRPARAAVQETADELRRYVTDNQGRMRYHSRRAKGLLVGSGPIEGGIGYVMQGRLKRTGMRWSVPGARHVLALRLRWANDEWDRPGARPLASA